MTKQNKIFLGGLLAFCANLISVVALEPLYQSCPNLVQPNFVSILIFIMRKIKFAQKAMKRIMSI